MKIVILGANGQTGKLLTRDALDNGHSVVGVVRNVANQMSNDNLSYVEGDATNEAVITEASNGSDAIISTLGGSDPSLMTNAINAVLASTAKTGIKRFILMSSFAVKQDHLDPEAQAGTMQMMKDAIADKTKSEELLKASSLDWTIIYATLLSEDPSIDGIRVVEDSEKIGMANGISRDAVSAFILETLEKSKYIKEEVIITQR